MKKILAVIVLCLLPSLALAQWVGPTVIGGAGVGYGVSGPENAQTFVYQFAGVKVKQLDAGAVYLCYQRGFAQGSEVGGSGGKLVLADQWGHCPSFSWVFGLGFLDNLQPLQDETPLKAGLTFDAGLSYDASQWFDIGVYGSAWDRGGRADWFLSIFGVIKDPQRLIPGMGK
jgi:hypothetical protein